MDKVINILVYSNSELAKEFYRNMFKNRTDINISEVNKNKFQTFINLINSDIVQIISADIWGIHGIIWSLIFLAIRLLGKPIVFYWIGTDVVLSDKKILKIVSPLIKKHISIAPWLVAELKEKGINADFYPNPITQDFKAPPPLPEEFTVLFYIGEVGREEFYNKPMLEKLTQTLSYRFIILGFNYLKYDEMPKIYARTTVLVRITKHDGFSNMVQEALNYGRHVIWSQKYPYCQYATDYDSVVSCLEEIRKNPTLNIDGMNYYRQDFNIEKCAERHIKLYHDILVNK